MNEVMTIQGVECYEVEGTAYLKLEAVARGLGFTQTQTKNGTEYTSVRWERVEQHLADFGFPHKWGKEDFIPENVFYRLAMRAKNETAESFQALIADEIIPAIRKHGGYLTPEAANQLAAVLDEVRKLSGRVEALEDMVTNPFGPLPSQAQALPAPPPQEMPPSIPGAAAKKRWMRTVGEKLDLMKARFNLTHNQVLHKIYQGLEKAFEVSLEEERLRTMEEHDLDECSTLTAIFYNDELRDYFENYIDYNLAPENRGW